MSVPQPICVHCRQTCTQRFEIVRFDRTNTAQPAIVTCSIPHLIAWAYEYATISGMRLAVGAKASFDSFMQSLRGLKS